MHEMNMEEKGFSVTCTKLSERFFSNPIRAIDYAFKCALEKDSDVDTRIFYKGNEIVNAKGVMCSPVLDKLFEKFPDPDGKDYDDFMQALEEKGKKGEVVFHPEVHLERPNGESFTRAHLKDFRKIILEFVEIAKGTKTETQVHCSQSDDPLRTTFSRGFIPVYTKQRSDNLPLSH